jgi:hypothetical protein
MSLRAIETLARPAMVTNKNFFSHAHPVFTAGVGICQALFSGGKRTLANQRAKYRSIDPAEKSLLRTKKACQRCAGFYNAHEFRAFFS